MRKLKENRSGFGWAIEEMHTADLGDDRLNRRLGNLLQMLSRKPNESIPAASRGWSETKAAYRFFDHDKVTLEKVLQPHKEATIDRMRAQPVILLPQDTTELDYSSQPEKKGIGKLSYENRLGMFVHPTIAVTPDRVCLGVVNCEVWVREKLKKKDEREKIRKSLSIEDKESKRWLNGYRVAQFLAEKLPQTKFVSISDREGDIYEIFVEATEAKKEIRSEFIIRGNQNRCLVTGNKTHKKLKEKIGISSVIGVVEFDLPAAKGRKARRVTQEIRAEKVLFRAPFRLGNKLSNVSINVVLAREINAPQGVEPIEWLLLTSLPIETTEQALQVISWYVCRWQIEIFFRILKSGCEVEELQLQTIERLKPCLGLYMIIAWRILHMTMLGRSCPDMPCSILFDEEEWHAAYMVVYRRAVPLEPPDLNAMIKIVASLGGFLGRKGDGFPGAQTIWIGLQRMRDFVIAMEAQNASRETYG